MKTTEEVKEILKNAGFNLSVRKCTGTLKQYYIVGSRKINGLYQNINTPELTAFLNENFVGFDGKKFDQTYSYNGGLSTLINKFLNA